MDSRLLGPRMNAMVAPPPMQVKALGRDGERRKDHFKTGMAPLNLRVAPRTRFRVSNFKPLASHLQHRDINLRTVEFMRIHE